MKPKGMLDHNYKRYQENGFNESEIEQIQKDTLYFRNRMAQKKIDREITCSTYERAEKRLTKEVAMWMGNR